MVCQFQKGAGEFLVLRNRRVWGEEESLLLKDHPDFFPGTLSQGCDASFNEVGCQLTTAQPFMKSAMDGGVEQATRDGMEDTPFPAGTKFDRTGER
jgi:hypothetical protein